MALQYAGLLESSQSIPASCHRRLDPWCLMLLHETVTPEWQKKYQQQLARELDGIARKRYRYPPDEAHPCRDTHSKAEGLSRDGMPLGAKQRHKSLPSLLEGSLDTPDLQNHQSSLSPPSRARSSARGHRGSYGSPSSNKPPSHYSRVPSSPDLKSPSGHRRGPSSPTFKAAAAQALMSC